MVSPRRRSVESIVIPRNHAVEVVGKPSIGAVLDDFLKFCEGRGGGGPFSFPRNLSFLNKELKRCRKEVPAARGGHLR